MKTRLLTVSSLAAVVLLTACDKKEAVMAPPVPSTPTPVAAPAPVVPTPAPAPVAPAPVAPAPAPAAPSAEASPEKAAIAKLSSKLGEIEEIMKVKPSAENPMAQVTSLRAMLVEMAQLPTAGLPADLKDTVGTMQDLFGRVGKSVLPFFDGIPTEPDALKQWGADLAKDPAKMQEIGAKMAGMGPALQEFDAEMKTKQAAAKVVFDKYGIKTPGE